MRVLTGGWIAAVALLFATSSASAFAVSMTARGATTGLTTSETVTVDVFLDADNGITIFSVGVLNSSTSALLYDGPASAALTPIAACYFGACTGAQPSYILYGAGRTPAVLYPLNSPYFLTFPAPPGTEQVNINYLEDGFGTTTATGTGIYIATLVFHVVAAFASESLSLAFTSSNIIQAGTFVVPSTSIGLSAPILLNVPEPTTAMLIGLGIVGLGLAGRNPATHHPAPRTTRQSCVEPDLISHRG